MKRKIDIDPKLREFLKKKRVLGKFEQNCRRENVDYLVDSPGGGFFYFSSPEGHDFWMSLQHEFNKNRKL